MVPEIGMIVVESGGSKVVLDDFDDLGSEIIGVGSKLAIPKVLDELLS